EALRSVGGIVPGGKARELAPGVGWDTGHVLPILPFGGSLPLAPRAVERRPLALPHGSDRRAAGRARQPFAAVDRVLELERAGLSGAVDVVAQRAAALVEGFGQRPAHGVDQPRQPRAGQPAGGARGPDAGAEQRLV